MHICVFADFDDEKDKGKERKQRKGLCIARSRGFFFLLTECIGSIDGQFWVFFSFAYLCPFLSNFLTTSFLLAKIP